MSIEYLKSLRDVDSSDVSWEILDYLRGHTASDVSGLLSFAAVTAILYLVDGSDLSRHSVLGIIESRIKEERTCYYLKDIARRHEQFIIEKANMYPTDKLLAILLYADYYDSKAYGEFDTPDTVSNLVYALMDIGKGDRVADFGAGRGNFLISSYLKSPHAHYTGIERNAEVLTYFCIRNLITGLPIDIKQTDLFLQSKDDRKYDKIFSNCGFGISMGFLAKSISQNPSIRDVLSKLPRSASGEWAYNLAMIQNLEENGRAIGIMGNGATFRDSDWRLRKYFIDRGYVETVIILPEKLFDYTMISTAMVVFSHNNKTINMIDATEIYTEGRRNNYLSREDIEQILGLLGTVSKRSTVVPYEKVISENYHLFPRRYLDVAPEIKCGAPLGDLVTEIKRGVEVRADRLDELASVVETEIQYLPLQSVEGGFIAEELPYLKSMEPNWDKYCLEDRNIVLSRNAASIKTAVVEVPKGKTIVCSHNLYIIRVDESRANPYYIKAFFESPLGGALLKNASVGSVLQTIALRELRNMQIPLIPLDEQKRFEQHYTAIMDDIKLLQRKLCKSKTDLRDLINQYNEEVSKWY